MKRDYNKKRAVYGSLILIVLIFYLHYGYLVSIYQLKCVKEYGISFSRYTVFLKYLFQSAFFLNGVKRRSFTRSTKSASSNMGVLDCIPPNALQLPPTWLSEPAK